MSEPEPTSSTAAEDLTGSESGEQIEQRSVKMSGDSDRQIGAPEFGSDVADKVYSLLSPVITTVGAELLDVEWTGGTLRLVLDAEGGVTTERLTEVNRLVSPLLDQHDPVPGRYLLEVSSPGVERPLRRVDHFHRAVGEQVIVKLEPWSEIRRIRGELLTVDDKRISIGAVETDGVDLPDVETMEIAHQDIAKARTHFVWGPTPKKGTPGSGKKNKSTSETHSKTIKKTNSNTNSGTSGKGTAGPKA